MNVRYYIYALLFVIFDVEAVFVFPWAIQAESLSWFGLIEIFVFIAVLLARVGLPLAQGVAHVGLIDKGTLRKTAQAARRPPQLQPQVLAVDVPVGPRLLRDRDGRRAREPSRTT